MNDSAAGHNAIAVEAVTIGQRQTRISTAIVVLLCAIPAIAMVLFGAVDNITWVLLTTLCFTVVVLWAIETWRARGILIDPNVLCLPLLGLLGLGLVQISAGMSQNPFGTRIFLTRIVVLIVVFVASLTFINTEKRLRAVFSFVLVFGAIAAFVGILQKLADPESIYGLRRSFGAVPFGPFVNGHHFAAFMEMTAGLALGLLFGTAKRDRKLLTGIALAIMVIASILTGSRGGMLSFAVLIGTSLMLRGMLRPGRDEQKPLEESGPLGRKATAIIGTAAVIVGVLGAIIFIGGDRSLIRGIGLASAEDVSNDRLHFWSIAIQMFRDHPFLGVGLDGYGIVFPRYDDWTGLYRVEQTHNDYLQMLAEGGVIALALVVSFIVLLVRRALRTIRRAKAGFRRDVAIGALTGCSGVLVHSFFDFPLRTWSNAFFFLLVVTLATVSVKAEEDPTPRKKRRRLSSAPSQGSPSTRTAAQT